MPRKSAKAAADDWSYEASVQSVESVIRQLETGDLPLDAVFTQFAQAVEQLQKCDAFLQSKQDQAQLLIETLAEDSASN